MFAIALASQNLSHGFAGSNSKQSSRQLLTPIPNYLYIIYVFDLFIKIHPLIPNLILMKLMHVTLVLLENCGQH